MAVETASDRALMLGVADFGTVAVYRRGTVNYSVAGIFDNAYQPVEMGELEYSSLVPEFLMATSDIPSGGVAGDKLTVASVQYTITNIEPDGTGITRLVLRAPA